MNDLQFTQLGVAGVIVAILLVAVRVLWTDNQTLRREQRDDQKAILPALVEATQALAAATSAIEHVSRLYDDAVPRRRDAT